MRAGALVAIVFGLAAPAAAQSTGELWGNLTIDWLASERTNYILDVEPKVQVTSIDQSRFSNIDVWPTVEYAVSEWFDVEGELLAGFTNEEDGSNTTEVTERLGARFHILSRLIQERDARRGVDREKQPKKRGTIATLVRFEHRDLFKSESPDTSLWRLRNRIELAYPLNRQKLTAQRARAPAELQHAL